MTFEISRHIDAKTGCSHAHEILYYFLYYYILAPLLFTGSRHSGWLLPYATPKGFVSPPGLEQGIFHKLGEHVNHYTRHH